MNIKKALLYLLLGIVLLICAYNYLLLPMLYQSSSSSEMGMHMWQYNNNNYNFYSYFAYIIIIIIFIIVLLIFVEHLFINSSGDRCKKCGMRIENSKWKICPKCGDKLK